jgi:hypothetical protein
VIESADGKATRMNLRQPTTPHRTAAVLGGLLVLLTVAGCGSPPSTAPQAFKVTGTVKYDDGRPVSPAAIQFSPVNDTTFTAYGDIADDGSFTLTALKGNARLDGVPEGEYEVTILLPIGANQQRPPPIILAQKYRIEAKDNHFTIELPSKK